MCDEIRLALAEVRRRTPSAEPARGPRGTTPRLTVRGTAAGAPPPPPPPPPTHPLNHSPTHPLTHSPTHPLTHSPTHPLTLKVLPWVVDGAGGLGAGKTSGAGTRGVDLNAAVGARTGDTDTNGGESSNN